MAAFELRTTIAATAPRCFDLSRDIDPHVDSMRASRERAVRGVTTGLIGPGQEVTWLAWHLGMPWRMTSRITGYERPHRFTDEMVSGPFATWRHEHRFDEFLGGTSMRDLVTYEAPLGGLGRLADRLVLERYLRRLLGARNALIKARAEQDG